MDADAELAEISALADQQGGKVRSGLLPADFLLEETYNEAKSKAEGRACYTDVEIIQIRVGGDVIRRPVSEEDKRRYAAQYLAWKKGESQEAVEGFPLSQWAAMPGKALAREFAFLGIRTVEQLASATDSTIQRIGPYLNLRQKARDWVADAEKQAPLVRLRDENEAMKSRLGALEQMVAKQSQELAAARANGGTLPGAPTQDVAALIAEQVAKAVAAALPPERERVRPPKKAT